MHPTRWEEVQGRVLALRCVVSSPRGDSGILLWTFERPGPANGNGRPARSFRRFGVFPLVDAGLQPPNRGSRWSRRARLLVSFKNWDHRFSGINTFRCGFFFDSKTGGPGPTSRAPIALGMYPPRIHRIFLRLSIDFKPPGSHKCRA